MRSSSDGVGRGPLAHAQASDRDRSRARRRRPAADIPDLVNDARHRGGVTVFTIALVVPLLWRQRRPMPVFLVLAAVAFAQWLADVKVIADVALLIALYTVAVHESRRRALFAAAVLELGAVLAVVRWTKTVFRPFVALSALTIAAGVLGTSVRHRRALLASLEDRAARLELRARPAGPARGRRRARTHRARDARHRRAQPDGHDRARRRRRVRGRARTREGDHGDGDRVARPAARRSTEMRRLLGVLRDGRVEAELLPLARACRRSTSSSSRCARRASRHARGRAATAAAARQERQLTVFRLVQEALTNTPQARRGLGGRPRATPLRRGRRRRRGHRQRAGAAARATPGGQGLDGHAGARGRVRGHRRGRPSRGGGWRVHAHLWLEQSAAPG